MPKLKTRNIVLKILILCVSALPFIMPALASAVAQPPDPGSSSSGGSAATATCDPTDDKEGKWCKGKCDISFEKNVDGSFVTDKNGNKVQNNPDVAKDPTKVRSCKCDGTPNLNLDQVKSCEACNKVTTPTACLRNNVIVKDLDTIVKFLSALVGVVITAMIIVGGIQYTLAGDKAESITAAKKRITAALVAMVVFLLIFTIVQWLIPGGIFSS